MQIFLKNLYIPIWFYSNEVKGLDVIDVDTFTFQSGSIQIFLASKNDESFSRFTFQSGSIQIIGDNLGNDMSSTFTFQSGSIQIQAICIKDTHMLLYIPIWFYSNLRGTHLRIARKTLYIPIWFYSNVPASILSL